MGEDGLVKCVVSNVHPGYVKIRSLDFSRKYDMDRKILEEGAGLKVRKGHPVLARVKEPEKGHERGLVLEMMIDEERIPKGEQKGRLAYTNRDAWGIITTGKELNTFEIFVHESGVKDANLHDIVLLGLDFDDIVQYRVVNNLPEGLRAVDVKPVIKGYSGELARLRKRAFPDYGSLLVTNSVKAEERGDKNLDGSYVFLHQSDILSVGMYLIKGQNYHFNVLYKDDNLRAVDAKLDSSVPLKYTGRVAKAYSNGISIDSFNNGTIMHASNLENLGDFAEGDFVKFFVDPLKGRDITSAIKIDEDSIGDVPAEVYLYDKTTKRGWAKPVPSYKGKFAGEKILFNEDDILRTENPRVLEKGGLVRVDNLLPCPGGYKAQSVFLCGKAMKRCS